ncbi:MAG: hypothetical protein WCT22_00600 [Patescibacteria group bacterium]
MTVIEVPKRKAQEVREFSKRNKVPQKVGFALMLSLSAAACSPAIEQVANPNQYLMPDLSKPDLGFNENQKKEYEQIQQSFLQADSQNKILFKNDDGKSFSKSNSLDILAKSTGVDPEQITNVTPDTFFYLRIGNLNFAVHKFSDKDGKSFMMVFGSADQTNWAQALILDPVQINPDGTTNIKSGSRFVDPEQQPIGGFLIPTETQGQWSILFNPEIVGSNPTPIPAVPTAVIAQNENTVSNISLPANFNLFSLSVPVEPSNPTPVNPTPLNPPTPNETSTSLPPAVDAVDANKIFSTEQMAALSQHGLSFDAGGNLTQKFTDAGGKEQVITVGHLEADGLHVTDFGTGMETVIKPESILNYHQESNVLFNDILKGVDAKDANIIWIYNSEHGWFKQIKDGDFVSDNNAFNKGDNRILLSELVDSEQIDSLFPDGSIPADFFINFEADKSGFPFAFIGTYKYPGVPGWHEYYSNTYGSLINKANNSFHLWRTYHIKLASGAPADVRTQAVLDHDGKTKTLEHFVWGAGNAPEGDFMDYLIFALLPPYSGTEARALFDANISLLSYNGGQQQDLTGLEFLSGSESILLSQDQLLSAQSHALLPLNQGQIKGGFSRVLSGTSEHGYVGPYNRPPSEIQQTLLIPIWVKNFPVTSGTGK